MVKIGRPRKTSTDRQKPKSPPQITTLRTGGRIKKAKVVFDPSDNYLPKKFKKENQNDSGRKIDSNPSSPETTSIPRAPAQKSTIREDFKRKEPEEQCSICSKYEPKRLKLMIFCLDCNDRVHPKCLNINYKDFNTLKEKYRCGECKSCVQCYEGKDEGQLVTCKYCIDSYHFKCHVPEVSRKSVDPNDWTCIKCVGKKENENKKRSRISIASRDSKTSVLSESQNFDGQSLSSHSSAISSVVSKQEPIDDGYENSHVPTSALSSARGIKVGKKTLPKILPSSSEVQSMSTEQIHKLFEAAFPSESKFITRNEIDGQALLLLTREDVVRKGSPWKLGGLLKFYNAILRIQNNTKNNAVAWS